MKFFLVFLTLAMLVSVQGLTNDVHNELIEAEHFCLEESGADSRLVNKAKSGDFDFDDAKTKQFLLCFFKKLKMIDDEGSFNKAIFLLKVDDDAREKFDKIIDACIDKKGDTMEDIAWNYMKCFQSNMPKHRKNA